MAVPPPPPPPGILPVNFASYVVFLHGGLKEVHEPFFDVSKFNCLSYFFGKPNRLAFGLINSFFLHWVHSVTPIYMHGMLKVQAHMEPQAHRTRQ